MDSDQLFKLAILRQLSNELVAVHRVQRILILELGNKQRKKGRFAGQRIIFAGGPGTGLAA
jgi:hypothetical protein